MTHRNSRGFPVSPLQQYFEELCAYQVDTANNGMWPYLPVLYQLVLSQKLGRSPNIALEIGVNQGRSTVAILAALEMLPDAKLISVDIDLPLALKDKLASLDDMAKGNAILPWRFIQGDSWDTDTIREVGAKIIQYYTLFRRAKGLPIDGIIPATPIAKLKFLLIDGAFENRMNDLKVYGPFVDVPGVIAIHDTNRVEVKEQVKMYLEMHLSHAPYNYHIAQMSMGHGLTVITKTPK